MSQAVSIPGQTSPRVILAVVILAVVILASVILASVIRQKLRTLMIRSAPVRTLVQSLTMIPTAMKRAIRTVQSIRERIMSPRCCSPLMLPMVLIEGRLIGMLASQMCGAWVANAILRTDDMGAEMLSPRADRVLVSGTHSRIMLHGSAMMLDSTAVMMDHSVGMGVPVLNPKISLMHRLAVDRLTAADMPTLKALAAGDVTPVKAADMATVNMAPIETTDMPAVEATDVPAAKTSTMAATEAAGMTSAEASHVAATSHVSTAAHMAATHVSTATATMSAAAAMAVTCINQWLTEHGTSQQHDNAQSISGEHGKTPRGAAVKSWAKLRQPQIIHGCRLSVTKERGGM